MISLKAVLIILAFWCNSTYSQNTHLTFNGIALNGDAGTIYSNLVKKGFYQSTDKDYTVEGTFIIPKAHIEVLRTDESNKGYGVEISFTLPSKWGMEITKDTLVDYIKRTYKAVWAGGYGKDGYNGEVEFEDNLGEINISSVSITHNVTVSFGDDFNGTRYY